jgi:hypothetical protein
MWLFCRKVRCFRLIFGQIRANPPNPCHGARDSSPRNAKFGDGVIGPSSAACQNQARSGKAGLGFFEKDRARTISSTAMALHPEVIAL